MNLVNVMSVIADKLFWEYNLKGKEPIIKHLSRGITDDKGNYHSGNGSFVGFESAHPCWTGDQQNHKHHQERGSGEEEEKGTKRETKEKAMAR